MVLQLDNDQARKQREQEKLLMQMQLNARGSEQAGAILRARQDQVANVNYMRQDAARRAQAAQSARLGDQRDARMQYGRQLGVQNNAAGIATNAAIQKDSQQRRMAELVDKLQRGQLDVNQKHELEQLTIKQIQELEQMREQNQLGQGDMRLQDDLQRGQNEQRQGFAMQGKAADYGYGAMGAAQQQQYGMQNKEADFGYKTREQAQRDAQAAAMAEFQARQQMERDQQQHGFGQQDLRLADELTRGQNEQQHGFGLEAQGQQNDFYLSRDSLEELRKVTATAATQLSQLKLPQEASRERDKMLAELRLIQSQTPSGGKTGAQQLAQRLGKWGERVASADFQSQVVQEPTVQELYGKQTFVDPDTGQRMQSDGKGGFSPVFPVGKTPKPVDPEGPMKDFLDAYMKQSKVFKGRNDDDEDIYEPPNFMDALKAWDEREAMLAKRRSAGSAKPADWWMEGAQGSGGPSPQQQRDFLAKRQQTSPGAGNDVVQYAPRDQQQAPQQQAAPVAITPEIVLFVQAHAEKSRGMGLEFGEYLATLDPQSRAMLERAYQAVTQR